MQVIIELLGLVFARDRQTPTICYVSCGCGQPGATVADYENALKHRGLFADPEAEKN